MRGQRKEIKALREEGKRLNLAEHIKLLPRSEEDAHEAREAFRRRRGPVLHIAAASDAPRRGATRAEMEASSIFSGRASRRRRPTGPPRLEGSPRGKERGTRLARGLPCRWKNRGGWRRCEPSPRDRPCGLESCKACEAEKRPAMIPVRGQS